MGFWQNQADRPLNLQEANIAVESSSRPAPGHEKLPPFPNTRYQVLDSWWTKFPLRSRLKSRAMPLWNSAIFSTPPKVSSVLRWTPKKGHSYPWCPRNLNFWTSWIGAGHSTCSIVHWGIPWETPRICPMPPVLRQQDQRLREAGHQLVQLWRQLHEGGRYR